MARLCPMMIDGAAWEVGQLGPFRWNRYRPPVCRGRIGRLRSSTIPRTLVPRASARRDGREAAAAVSRCAVASLEAFAKRQGKPKSLVAEAALASFLSPDDSDRREAAVTKRLDRIVRVLERLERNDGVALETIALFIRLWLTSTPALPEHSNPAARAKGAERYDRFVEALGRRLSSGSTILKEVSIDSNDAGNAACLKGDAAHP
jgi:hypothetical protein